MRQAATSLAVTYPAVICLAVTCLAVTYPAVTSPAARRCLPGPRWSGRRGRPAVTAAPFRPASRKALRRSCWPFPAATPT
jgi:hypothetical protein